MILHYVLWCNRQPVLYPQTSADSFAIWVGFPRSSNIQLLRGGVWLLCKQSVVGNRKEYFSLGLGHFEWLCYIAHDTNPSNVWRWWHRRLKFKTNFSAVASGCPWFCLACKNVVEDYRHWNSVDLYSSLIYVE